MGKKKTKAPLPLLPGGVSIIDTHCHLDMLSTGEDIAQIINRAAANGVDAIITVGINIESSDKAVNIAAQYDSVFATVGVHPHNVLELGDDSYAALEKLCTRNKVVAYGEIGLDYVRQYAPRPLQREHFARQVSLAKKMSLPLVIHDREAHEDILHLLVQEAPFPAGGVMHCFSGDWDFARKILELGFIISIPGVVTFKKADVLQEVARKIPLNRMVLETDAPFLAPEPLRGKRNTPELMLYTAMKIAELKAISLEEVARATTENALKLFNIPRT
jgi:TatD DNase family protein